jgi:hypothetical protein
MASHWWFQLMPRHCHWLAFALPRHISVSLAASFHIIDFRAAPLPLRHYLMPLITPPLRCRHYWYWYYITIDIIIIIIIAPLAY